MAAVVAVAISLVILALLAGSPGPTAHHGQPRPAARAGAMVIRPVARS